MSDLPLEHYAQACEVDKTTGKYLDIDTVRLIREARTLLDFIQKNVDPLADEFHIWTTVVPLCEGVINKTLRNVSITLRQ